MIIHIKSERGHYIPIGRVLRFLRYIPAVIVPGVRSLLLTGNSLTHSHVSSFPMDVVRFCILIWINCFVFFQNAPTACYCSLVLVLNLHEIFVIKHLISSYYRNRENTLLLYPKEDLYLLLITISQ